MLDVLVNLQGLVFFALAFQYLSGFQQECGRKTVIGAVFGLAVCLLGGLLERGDCLVELLHMGVGIT